MSLLSLARACGVFLSTSTILIGSAFGGWPYVTPTGQYRGVWGQDGNGGVTRSEFGHLGAFSVPMIVASSNDYGNNVSAMQSQKSFLRATSAGGLSIDFSAAIDTFGIIADVEQVGEPFGKNEMMSSFRVEGSARYVIHGTAEGFGGMAALTMGDSNLEEIYGTSESQVIFRTGELEEGDYVFSAGTLAQIVDGNPIGGKLDLSVLIIPEFATFAPEPVLPINVPVVLSKKVYEVGDVISIRNLSIYSADLDSGTIEWKAALETPAGEAIEILDFGADESFEMKNIVFSSQIDFGPIDMLEVDESLEKGVYRIASRALDSVTGELMGENFFYFLIR